MRKLRQSAALLHFAFNSTAAFVLLALTLFHQSNFNGEPLFFRRGSTFSNSSREDDAISADAAKLMSELLIVPQISTPTRTRRLNERRRSSLELHTSPAIPAPKSYKIKRSKSPDRSLIPGLVPVRIDESEMPYSPFRKTPNSSIKRKGSSGKKSGRRKSLT